MSDQDADSAAGAAYTGKKGQHTMDKPSHLRIGGPQGSGIDHVASLFARSCDSAGAEILTRREYHSNIIGRHSYVDIALWDNAPLSVQAHCILLISFDAETLFRHGHGINALGVLIYDPATESNTLDRQTLLDEALVQQLTHRDSVNNISDLLEAGKSRAVTLLALALAAGYAWIGHGYAYTVNKLASLIQQAISYSGLALLDVLQPCPTYNDLHTHEWFESADDGDGSPRLYWLDESGCQRLVSSDRTEDEAQAIRLNCYVKTQEWGKRIPLGVLLQDLASPAADEAATHKHPIPDADGRSLTDIESCYDNLLITPHSSATGDNK